VIDGNILFATAGALAIFAGLAAYQVVDALRWKEGRRGVVAIAAFSMFTIAAGVMFLFASKHATFNFWGNAGLGPDWECSYAPSSARVCNRDLPAQLQDRPPSKNQ
jgi:hypothetical protein